MTTNLSPQSLSSSPSSAFSPALTQLDTNLCQPPPKIAKFFDWLNAKVFRSDYEYATTSEISDRFQTYITACTQTSGRHSINEFLLRLSESLPPELLNIPYVTRKIAARDWPCSPTYTHLVNAALMNPAYRMKWEEQGLLKITVPQAEAFMRRAMYGEFYRHVAIIEEIRQSNRHRNGETPNFPTVFAAYEALPASVEQLGLDEAAKAHLRFPVLLMQYINGRPLSTLTDEAICKRSLPDSEFALPSTTARSQSQAGIIVQRALQALHSGWNAYLEYDDWALDNLVETNEAVYIVDYGGFVPLFPTPDSSKEELAASMLSPDDPAHSECVGPNPELELQLIQLLASYLPKHLHASTHESFLTHRFRRFPLDPCKTFLWQTIMQGLTQKAQISDPWPRVDVMIKVYRFAKNVMQEELQDPRSDWHIQALCRIRRGLLQQSEHDLREALDKFKYMYREFQTRLYAQDPGATELQDFWLPTRMMREFGSIFDGEWFLTSDAVKDASKLSKQLPASLKKGEDHSVWLGEGFTATSIPHSPLLDAERIKDCTSGLIDHFRSPSIRDQDGSLSNFSPISTSVGHEL